LAALAELGAVALRAEVVDGEKDAEDAFGVRRAALWPVAAWAIDCEEAILILWPG